MHISVTNSYTYHVSLNASPKERNCLNNMLTHHMQEK